MKNLSSGTVAKHYAKMGMGADVEYSKLYEQVVTVLRSFQETAYKMLLKHVEGIRLSEFQAKLELAAGMKLKLEEVRFDRFSQFLLDCDFLEIRSRGDRKGSTNDLYVFVLEDWIDDGSKGTRKNIPKYSGRVYREDTSPEEKSVLTYATPAWVTPASAMLMSDVLDVGAIETADSRYGETEPLNETQDNLGIFERPVVRIRRTTVFEEEKRGGDRRLNQFNYPVRPRSRPGSRDNNSQQSKLEPNVVKDIKAKIPRPLPVDLLTANCSSDSFPEFIWPMKPFAIKLLGCDFESCFYIRSIEDKAVQESFEKQKLALKALSISWPDKVQSLVAIERTKLKKGMVVLAMDYNTSLFCRALVLSIDNDVDAEFPVTYLDLDEGEEFIASFAPTFVIPPEYRKTYFQATKVGLSGHEEYIGTDALLPVFPMVPNLSRILICELVNADQCSKLPLVDLRYESGGPVINFKSFM